MNVRFQYEGDSLLSSESGHSDRGIKRLLSANSGRSTKILKQMKNGLSLIT